MLKMPLRRPSMTDRIGKNSMNWEHVSPSKYIKPRLVERRAHISLSWFVAAREKLARVAREERFDLVEMDLRLLAEETLLCLQYTVHHDMVEHQDKRTHRDPSRIRRHAFLSFFRQPSNLSGRPELGTDRDLCARLDSQSVSITRDEQG